MHTYEIVMELGSIGCLIAGCIALFVWVAPFARHLRASAKQEKIRTKEIHEALWGAAGKKDESGATVQDARPGLVAAVRALQAEFPKNGRPAREVLDALFEDVRATQKDLAMHKVDAEAQHTELWDAIRGNTDVLERNSIAIQASHEIIEANHDELTEGNNH